MHQLDKHVKLRMLWIKNISFDFRMFVKTDINIAK